MRFDFGMSIMAIIGGGLFLVIIRVLGYLPNEEIDFGIGLLLCFAVVVGLFPEFFRFGAEIKK